MSLQRFRDLDDARHALWIGREKQDLATRVRSLWAFAARLAPGSAPRGVRKFRTASEANLDREAWMDRRARELRKARTR